jgi:pSer/pThr/pTyr-binding forkhead associated (FHA) protein
VFTIGRAPDCDLVLADPTVSWHHAELRWGADGWQITDLGSTNGTLVNGWRVGQRFAIRPGDCVALGHTSFRLTEHA